MKIDEIWILVRESDGEPVPSLDDAPGGETYLFAATEGDAIRACDYQRVSYDVDCRPVRVKLTILHDPTEEPTT